MIYHITAFTAGYLLDLLLGDPRWMPHPVRFIGWQISSLTNLLLKEDDTPRLKRIKGFILMLIVITIAIFLTGIIVFTAYTINSYFGTIIETVITYQSLATKSLYSESMKVYYALRDEGLVAGRKAVSMIVGRDTDSLDDVGVTKAAIETVAENTSDGIIAPMIYLALGGPVAGMVYKAINTMDSMIGYRNDKYYYFGTAAARLDDYANFIPARISAYLMIVASGILGTSYSCRDAARVYLRDRYNHASPNSAQTESACAGALGIQLAGPASYFGTIYNKPYIGDSSRKVELEDIKRANKLMITTSIMCVIICLIIMVLVEVIG